MYNEIRPRQVQKDTFKKSKMWPLKEKLKGTLIVPIALVVFLIPFSMLVGWNLLTAILFWFFIVPAVALYLPNKVSRNKGHLLETLSGLIIFYGFMVFMIYDHFKTDLFQIMIVSCFVNLVLVSLINWAGRKMQTQ